MNNVLSKGWFTKAMTVACLVSATSAQTNESHLDIDDSTAQQKMCDISNLDVNLYGNSPAFGDSIKFVFMNKAKSAVNLQQQMADGSLSEGTVVKAGSWTMENTVVNGVWKVTNENTGEIMRHYKVSEKLITFRTETPCKGTETGYMTEGSNDDLTSAIRAETEEMLRQQSEDRQIQLGDDATLEADKRAIIAMNEAAEVQRVRLQEMARISARNAQIEAESIAISAANEADKIQRMEEAKWVVAEKEAELQAWKLAQRVEIQSASQMKEMKKIADQIAMRRAKDLLTIRGVSVEEAERLASVARENAIRATEAVNASARLDLDKVIAENKRQSESLKAKAMAIDQDLKIKVAVVARARALAEAARKNALAVQTVSAANSALYRAKLHAVAKAEKQAAEIKSQEAWAQVTVFYQEMNAANAKARATLFKNWDESLRRMTISAKQVKLINNDIVTNARKVVEEARIQSYILLKAREANEAATKEAETKAQEALMNLIKAKNYSQNAKKVGDLQILVIQAKAMVVATQEAEKQIADQVTKKNEDIQAAEDKYLDVKEAAEDFALNQTRFRVQEAEDEMERKKQDAMESFAKMKLQIEKEKELKQKKARTDKTNAVNLEVVMRAKEAARAAQALRRAELRVKAAKEAWKIKLQDARTRSIAETNEIRLAVMKRISHGQEAARIQAEASMRAETLQAAAYQQALYKAKSLKQSLKITIKSMQDARKTAKSNRQQKEKMARDQYAQRQSSIWFEAYQNHRSSARVDATNRQEEQRILEEERQIALLTTKVAGYKMKISEAEAKIKAGERIREEAEINVKVQIEVQARHRQAVEDARLKAETDAKTTALQNAKKTQQKANALAKITAEKMELHVKSMEQTHVWAKNQRKNQKDEHKVNAKKEAESIQAEARARARVASEAANIQQQKMAGAEAAFEAAKKEVQRLKLEWTEATQTYEASLVELTALQQDIEQRNNKLALAERTAEKAQLRWKTLAQQRAARQAEQIIASAEQRERERWEAKRINVMALNQAKQVLKDANKKALKVKEQVAQSTKTFSTIFESQTVSHSSLEAMNAWKALSHDQKVKILHEKREVKLEKAKAEYYSAMAAVDETTWESMLKTIVGQITDADAQALVEIKSKKAMQARSDKFKADQVKYSQYQELESIDISVAAKAKKHAEKMNQILLLNPLENGDSDATVQEFIEKKHHAQQASVQAEKLAKKADESIQRTKDASAQHDKSKAELKQSKEEFSLSYIQLSAMRKATEKYIEQYCAIGQKRVDEALAAWNTFTVTGGHDESLVEKYEHTADLMKKTLIDPNNSGWCKAQFGLQDLNGFDKSDLPTAHAPLVLDVNGPKITWEGPVIGDDFYAKSFTWILQGNIGSSSDPVWITVADEIARADIQFNGETTPQYLKKTWLEARKGAQNTQQFRMVIEDQSGVRSLPSTIHFKSDAAAVSTSSFSGQLNAVSKDLVFTFSTQYDTNVQGYKLYAKLNGVDDVAFGEVNDPLASKITITRSQLLEAHQQRQLHSTAAGPIIFRLESMQADGHHNGENNVQLSFDQVFGDAVLVESRESMRQMLLEEAIIDGRKIRSNNAIMQMQEASLWTRNAQFSESMEGGNDW